MSPEAALAICWLPWHQGEVLYWKPGAVRSGQRPQQGKESVRESSQCNRAHGWAAPCSLGLCPQLWGNRNLTLLWITTISGPWIQFHPLKTRLVPSCLLQIYKVSFIAPAFQQVYYQQLLISTAGLVTCHNSCVYLLGIFVGLPCCWH